MRDEGEGGWGEGVWVREGQVDTRTVTLGSHLFVCLKEVCYFIILSFTLEKEHNRIYLNNTGDLK